MISGSLLPLILAMALAPLMQAVITRTKSVMAGRVGPSLLQPYWDLRKLLLKGAVYSRTTSWVFQLGPTIGLASVIIALTLIPFGGFPALSAFSGDLVLIVYLMALGRFCTVVAALDTGSSFEGMGASREVTFSALAEPAFFLALAALARQTGYLSLNPVLAAVSTATWMRAAPMLGLTIAALTIVFLAENSRMPVDDPATHLELTMIHEVMVLDHSGPDFAMIQYSAALKMWLFATIIVGVVAPWHSGNRWIDTAVGLIGMLVLGIATGLIESSMARLRLLRIPQLMLVAILLSALALAL
ncbi:MAG TPA: NADH-quinone oxidoreductase subunit H [Candidatus Binataceae bacterium]|nr:NADH-quinone oxidoreductase subunit H [Candidatus Binataceae bacterium]